MGKEAVKGASMNITFTTIICTAKYVNVTWQHTCCIAKTADKT